VERVALRVDAVPRASSRAQRDAEVLDDGEHVHRARAAVERRRLVVTCAATELVTTCRACALLRLRAA